MDELDDKAAVLLDEVIGVVVVVVVLEVIVEVIDA